MSQRNFLKGLGGFITAMTSLRGMVFVSTKTNSYKSDVCMNEVKFLEHKLKLLTIQGNLLR